MIFHIIYTTIYSLLQVPDDIWERFRVAEVGGEKYTLRFLDMNTVRCIIIKVIHF